AAVASGEWMRSRKRNSEAWKLCAPMEMRFTPCSCNSRRASPVTVPGFASSEISAAGERGARRRTAAITAPTSLAGTSPGVAPTEADRADLASLEQLGRSLDFVHQGATVVGLQVVHPGVRVEVAVAALHRAERDVDVDRERLHATNSLRIASTLWVVMPSTPQ